MEFRFHEKAKKNGCFVVSAAGFDSIPADLGVLYTMQQFQSPAVPSSVTSFLSFQIGQSGMVGKWHGFPACVLKSQVLQESAVSHNDLPLHLPMSVCTISWHLVQDGVMRKRSTLSLHAMSNSVKHVNMITRCISLQ